MNHEPIDSLPEDLKALDAVLGQLADRSAARPVGNAVSRRIRARLASTPTPLPARVVPIATPATPAPRRARVGLWLGLAAATFLVAALGTALRPGMAGDLQFQEGSVITSRTEHVRVGDRLRANKGHIVALLDQRAQLLMDEQTEVVVEKADALRLERGQVCLNIAPQSGHFQVRTPQGLVEVLGTEFEVHAGAGKTRVAVRRGLVKVSGGGGEEFVPAGSEATMTGLDGRPVVHELGGSPSIAWADDLARRSEAAQLRRYFPSMAPATGPAHR